MGVGQVSSIPAAELANTVSAISENLSLNYSGKPTKRPASEKKTAGLANNKPTSSIRKEPRVKNEPLRSMPTRHSKSNKSGFYAEANLRSLAWNGTGTLKDPIMLCS